MQALGDKAIIASQNAHGNFGAMADLLSSYTLPEQASHTSRVASARKGQDSQGLRCRISNMNDASTRALWCECSPEPSALKNPRTPAFLYTGTPPMRPKTSTKTLVRLSWGNKHGQNISSTCPKPFRADKDKHKNPNALLLGRKHHQTGTSWCESNP